MTQNSNTESVISDQEFLEEPTLAGARLKSKVGDKTTTILPTQWPASDPESDSELHSMAPLQEY